MAEREKGEKGVAVSDTESDKSGDWERDKKVDMIEGIKSICITLWSHGRDDDA